jgi:hypothetical protein
LAIQMTLLGHSSWGKEFLANNPTLSQAITTLQKHANQ